MKTNIILRKSVTENGQNKIIYRVLPVDLPDVDLTGWQVFGHTDCIEVLEGSDVIQVIKGNTKGNSKKTTSNVTKFPSTVLGTAKLFRKEGSIQIAFRKGKTTYNETTPNAVCISDYAKEQFFKDCRAAYGEGTAFWQFKTDKTTYYDKWNKFMDEEYQRQKTEYIASRG